MAMPFMVCRLTFKSLIRDWIAYFFYCVLHFFLLAFAFILTTDLSYKEFHNNIASVQIVWHFK